MQSLVKSLSGKFHDRHYLLILVKKHLMTMYGDDLGLLSKEELKERLKLCEEVTFTNNASQRWDECGNFAGAHCLQYH